jgi:hypothetical protein
MLYVYKIKTITLALEKIRFLINVYVASIHPFAT